MEIRDGVFCQWVQSVIVQGLELGQRVVCQQGLADAGGIGGQGPAHNGDGVAVQGGLHLFQVKDVAAFQTAQMAGFAAVRHNPLHQALDLLHQIAAVQITVAHMEGHAANAVAAGGPVQQQIAALPQRVQQRRDTAFGDAQPHRQLAEGVAAGGAAAQFQNVQRAGEGTVGACLRHKVTSGETLRLFGYPNTSDRFWGGD